MKYLIALILGMLLGAAVLFAGVIYNPFVADRGLSPLSVTGKQVLSLNFSAVPSDAIVFSNDGESRLQPYPEKVLQLWEAPIRLTSLMATVLRDARSQTAGIGVKFSSLSEKTKLLKGEVLVDSVWYLYLPERGSLFMEQSENHWAFWREVGIPAYRSSANNWKGTWLGDLTAGPGALGTAKVTGGSGKLMGFEMEAIESLSTRAYSVADGPIAADGRLLIELPAVDDVTDDESSFE